MPKHNTLGLTVAARLGTTWAFVIPTIIFSWSSILAADPPSPPNPIPDGPKIRPIAFPDGSFRCYRASGGQISSVESTDGGQTWSRPKPECKVPHSNMGGGIGILDADGEVHLILTHLRGEGKPADTRFIDLWHCRTTDHGKKWEGPKRIWIGYCGAVMDIKQLRSGRIIVPFAAWKKPGEDVARNTGSNYTTVLTSDDQGLSWHLSPVKLTAPCDPDYNGNNYGAIEPTILELLDGRVWMLMRAQTGFLVESFSKDGVHWTPATDSRFHSSTSPAALDRLPDGRIILFWNNCEMPLRHEGAGVYGGRDALHAAVSADEGKTWQGFREVYRDPFRNETPPRRGDRGTAYPVVAVEKAGQVLLVTGQGNRRTMIQVDPDWLTEPHQECDFSHDLSDWHVWKHFGPAAGFWRDRTAGPQLVDHPDRSKASVLHVRRPDEKGADCASWNFPAATSGRLRIRIRLNEDFAGAGLSLNDRFFNPGDDRGESESIFHLTISPDLKLTESLTLQAGTWSTLSFEWDLSKGTCRLQVNGQSGPELPLRNKAIGGISYLRLRSAAKVIDKAGFLIESVSVDADRRSAALQTQESAVIDAVPIRITRPGSYRLARDLTFPPATGAAVTIEADEVTLDLNGKTLSGSAGSATGAIGVLAVDRQRIIITNGRISGFYFGVDIRATDRDMQKSKAHVISNIAADRNWYFAIRLIGSRSEISGCAITNTGGCTLKAHTIPHSVRLVGENNVMRKNRICDMQLQCFPDGKGEIVGIHFDRAKNSVLEDNVIVEIHQEPDSPMPADDARERRFAVWVNGGPRKDTYLRVRNNVFDGFTVPLAFTPGSDGRVENNVFHNADEQPIRGAPASQLADNVTRKTAKPIDCVLAEGSSTIRNP